jgi:hypothetical protein
MGNFLKQLLQTTAIDQLPEVTLKDMLHGAPLGTDLTVNGVVHSRTMLKSTACITRAADGDLARSSLAMGMSEF